ENDSMTPVGQSEEFYVALKVAGVPTNLVIFKDEAHWFYRPVNKVRMIEYMLDWFRRYDPAFQ
ncbi:MAG: prolyl oligopeptidase family serine peptidase, partial [Gammaproteobacteria bacterium]|nr:prolyl oligopeptidase family serine peptidase [Gammaproteobacteria bacterium]